jgi:mRNA interferase RelE/StbE
VTGPYELGTAPPARRAIAELLPRDVAVAAVEFITGPLLVQPRRAGTPLTDQLSGIWSARLARDWRVLFEIDDTKHLLIVLDIRHRATAYRRSTARR